MDKYFLKADWESFWTEVAKEIWVNAEREAGFRTRFPRDDPEYLSKPATGGFSGHGVSGKIEYDKT
jgi:hypothetical protein